MKNIVSIVIFVAASLFALAAISSFTSVAFLGFAPPQGSLASISLLLIARAFIGCRSAGVFGASMEGGAGSVASDMLSRLAQISFFLSVLGFALGIVSFLTPGPLFGKLTAVWFQGSINVALIAILACYRSED